MGDVLQLGDFGGDTIVLHFGGSSGTIDAYTLAEALTGFADTALAINATVDPGQEIEIVVEATGPGSYRTVVRRVKKEARGLLSDAVQAVFWGIVANVIYDGVIKSDPKPEIVITTDEVTIKHGANTIIVPRHVYNASENAKMNPAVQRGLKKTFEALDADENVTDFGVTGSIQDPTPLVRIPRAEFPIIVNPPSPVPEVQPPERTRKQRARLLILKAWLNHAKRKWSFEWNGVPLSAPIHDKDFLDRLDRREHLLGAGDALDVEITFRQTRDEKLGVYVNDPNSFVVSRVIGPVLRG